MTYASAVSRSLHAPSSNHTNRSTTRPASRLANTVNDSFVEDIFRLREAHPNLSASELLALQRQAASPWPQRPRRATLPRGAHRAIHVVFTTIRPDQVPSPAMVVRAVNSRLPTTREVFQVSSANWSPRNNLTIRFTQAPEDPKINVARAALSAFFPNIPPSTYPVNR